MHRRSLIEPLASGENPFPVSVSACVIAEDTDTSRPGRSCTSAPGLADQKDTDRLMDIMHERTDSAPPARPSVCPICGLHADNGVPRASEMGMHTAYYRDAEDHIWSVQWLEVG